MEWRVCETIDDPAVIAWLDPDGRWAGLRSIARAVRSHWGIENGLHWVLDMGFREDESRVRSGHAQENLTVVRKLALLQHDPTRKTGVAASRKRAGWDTDYLRYLLTRPA